MSTLINPLSSLRRAAFIPIFHVALRDTQAAGRNGRNDEFADGGIISYKNVASLELPQRYALFGGYYY